MQIHDVARSATPSPSLSRPEYLGLVPRQGYDGGCFAVRVASSRLSVSRVAEDRQASGPTPAAQSAVRSSATKCNKMQGCEKLLPHLCIWEAKPLRPRIGKDDVWILGRRLRNVQ